MADLGRAKTYAQAGDLDLAALEYFTSTRKGTNESDRLAAEFELANVLLKKKLYYPAAVYFAQAAMHSGNNTYKVRAWESLSRIDQDYVLGLSFFRSLQEKGLKAEAVPDIVRGYYDYYLGRDSFSHSQWTVAKQAFERVGAKSLYSAKASFHLGVLAALENDSMKAVRHFTNALSTSKKLPNAAWIQEQTYLNLARIHYANKDYVRAIAHYAKIPRNSENWLTALFEGAWAFFLMEKPNNTLGNIHTLQSPFFEDRFTPETYILQGVTFLRLCQLDQVKETMQAFEKRYVPMNSELTKMLSLYKANPTKLADLVRSYSKGSLKTHREAWPLIGALMRVPSAKRLLDADANIELELNRIDASAQAWRNTGLSNVLGDIVRARRNAYSIEIGRTLFGHAEFYKQALGDLFDQAKLIQAELLLGRIEQLRRKLNIKATPKKENFIGGMQALVVGQDLEYWPFEGEYWEDELGGYVYNVESQCKK